MLVFVTKETYCPNRMVAVELRLRPMKEDTANSKSSPIKDANNLSGERKAQVSFDDILIDSVDEIVTEIVGVKVSPIFWRHYQAFIGITRDEMPHQLPKLFESIQTIFGTGDGSVGERVVKKMYAKADVPLEPIGSRPLAEYAEKLKQILAQDNNTGLENKTREAPFSSSFREIVDAAIDETLVGLLGQDASQVFFTHLRDERGVPRDMVAQRLDIVFHTLDHAFGIAGRTVGKAIMRNLYRTLRLKFVENPNFNVSDYVQEALFEYLMEPDLTD